MKVIFDGRLVVYESYSLLTTHHQETNYVLDTSNLDEFLFIKNSWSLGCSSKEQFALNNEDLQLFMNPVCGWPSIYNRFFLLKFLET